MNKLITDYLASITLGEAQEYKNITVFPLFSHTNHGPEYLTLKEAMERSFQDLNRTECSMQQFS